MKPPPPLDLSRIVLSEYDWAMSYGLLRCRTCGYNGGEMVCPYCPAQNVLPRLRMPAENTDWGKAYGCKRCTVCSYNDCEEECPFCLSKNDVQEIFCHNLYEKHGVILSPGEVPECRHTYDEDGNLVYGECLVCLIRDGECLCATHCHVCFDEKSSCSCGEEVDPRRKTASGCLICIARMKYGHI